jgi:hypothetical protein
MQLEIGHFYAHEGGRKIAVVGEVSTYKWNRMLVIEEADDTGHSISCTEATDIPDSRWVEIGKEEWLDNFGGMQ